MTVDREEIFTAAPISPLRLIAAPEELVDLLNTMNESGTDPRLVGVDNGDNPFLIHLIGPYAESTAVLFGSPWDSEVDYNNGQHCEECNGSNLFSVEDLKFPVSVMMTR